MLQRFFVFWFAFIGLASADPDLSILGRFIRLDPGLAYGVAALESQVLQNIRLCGKYGAKNDKFPSIHGFRQTPSPNIIINVDNAPNNNPPPIVQDMSDIDWPEGWVEAFIQYLFPSSGLIGLVESTRESEIAYKLWHNKMMIGRVIAALKNPECNQDEVVLTGALMKALNPNLGNDYRKLGAKALYGFTIKADPKSERTLAVLTAKAFFNGKDHPPQIVEQAFWALAWKTSSTAEEIVEVYKGMGIIDPLLRDPYNKKFIYDPFKNAFSKGHLSGAQKQSIAKNFAGAPFRATYVGAGYSYYDAPMPPNITYGETIYKEMRFSTCGEDSLWNVFNIFLWNNETKQFDTTKLQQIAKKFNIDVTLTEEDIKDKIFKEEWKPLKKVIWFYKKFPRPTKLQDARDLWTMIVSNMPNVTYKKSTKTSGNLKICELPGAAGIDNMQIVLANLIPDPRLQKGTRAEKFTHLCNLFSTDHKHWQWLTSDGKDTIEQNTDVTIDFSLDNTQMFYWKFSWGHFEVKPLINENKWQIQLGLELCQLLSQQPTFPQLNFYVSEKLVEQLFNKLNPEGVLFWTLVYGNIHDEYGKKIVISAVLKKKTKEARELYPFVETLMKHLPLDDARIQAFIIDRLFYDKGWIMEHGSLWMKKMLEKYEESKKELDIWTAAAEGYLNFVKDFVKDGVKVNARNKHVRTPLMEAARSGQYDVVQWLIEAGAPIDDATPYGDTALIYAAMNGHFDMVKLLAAKGATVTTISKMGYTAFTKAAENGHFEIVKFLFANGAKAQVNMKAARGETALILAARGGHLQIVEWLVENGANINAKLTGGETALMEAADNGHLPVVKWLAEKGASIKVKNKLGNTAFLLAAEGGHLTIMQWLASQGVDINSKNGEGDTAFILAANGGHLTIMQWLALKGMDINIRNEYGNTALFETMEEGYFYAAQWLVENGAHVNAINLTLETPLMMAATNGHLDIVQLLVVNGARVNAVNEDGETALIEGAEYLDVVKFLVNNGAYVNVKDKKGNSAFSITQDTNIKLFLVRVQEFMKYPHNFKTVSRYLNWAIKTLNDPPVEKFPEFPQQAVVVGILEMLLRFELKLEYFLASIARVALSTENNALTDQVWLELQDKEKFQKQALMISILESYVRNQFDVEKTFDEIVNTKSPIFKGMPEEMRKQYVNDALKIYGSDMAKLLEK